MLNASYTSRLHPSIELEFKILHCGNREFRALLVLWPWP